MASDAVQKLIAQNIEEQMASDEVRERITEEKDKQRSSQEYLSSVAKGLEENGENGEAYRALSDLREKLDDLQKFYDGLQDYTDGVSDLLDGTHEMKDDTSEFRTETADLSSTVQEKIEDIIAEKTGENVPLASFTDARNTDVDSVLFVITLPSIHIQTEEQTDDAEKTTEEGFLEKLMELFR